MKADTVKNYAKPGARPRNVSASALSQHRGGTGNRAEGSDSPRGEVRKGSCAVVETRLRRRGGRASASARRRGTSVDGGGCRVRAGHTEAGG